MAAMAEMAEIEKQCFVKGAQVEVQVQESGFRGSLYTATVLRTISTRTRKIFLEYHTLRSNERPTKPLRESVDFTLIRPAPPRESTRRRFRLSEVVDAFEDDGWWEGVVTAVHGDGRYCVFFRSSKLQLEFSGSDLRLHREWVHGNWVPPLEQEEDEEVVEEDAQEIPAGP